MKRITFWSGLTLFLFLAFAMNYEANAQFKLTSSADKICKGIGVFFNVQNPGTYSTILWTFGDGVTSNAPPPQSHAYTTPGAYWISVKTFNSSGGLQNVDSVRVRVYDNPVADMILPPLQTQCYEGNQFCFIDDSKRGVDKAPIKTYFWEFGDGDSSALKDPCKSYFQDGVFNVRLKIVDTNGCQDTVSRIARIRVLPKLEPKFVTQYTITCPITPVNFRNTTDTVGKFITEWYWDYAGGEYNGMTYDSTQSNWGDAPFKVMYQRDGDFHPKLIIKNAYGCVDSFTAYAGARNIFYWFDIKSSVNGEPTCWDGNNICYYQKPRPKAYYWLWVFDDPPSMQDNFNDEDWDPCHTYTNVGPYNVTLQIREPNCIRDTTFCSYAWLKGPMAMIKLPPPPAFPPNDCDRGKLISDELFARAKNPCHPDYGNTIDYVTLDTIAPFPVKVDSHYCNADTVSIDTTFKLCDTLQVVTQILYHLDYHDPTKTVTHYDSIIEYGPNTWSINDPIPPAPVFFPSGGTCTPQTVHDTDEYIHTCTAPNYVRFTNNSVKYRLRYASDDNPTSNTFPNDDVSQDLCKIPSFPWASDSLQFYWQFGHGDNCTSTEANPNIKCQFSTETQPWHLFDEEGCWSVSLEVYDTVMNCTSTANIQIVMEPPDAGWDSAVVDLFNTDPSHLPISFLDWKTQKIVKPLKVNGDPARIGMQLNGVPCVGGNYDQIWDLERTLPSCGRQDYWMIFDSAVDCQTVQCGSNPLDSITSCNWIPKMILEMIGKWNYGTGGCKTVGLIIKTGDCFDTFYYHEYKYIYDLSPGFHLLKEDPKKPGKYIPLDYANFEHLRLCPEHQLIICAANQDQEGITEFNFFINKQFGAPWTEPYGTADTFIKPLDTFYRVCHKDSFTIDIFTFDTIYNYCFMAPEPASKCGVQLYNSQTLDNLIKNGFFAKDTFVGLNMEDTLFIKDKDGKSLWQPGKYNINAIIRNLYNCGQLGAAPVYVGHYTEFEASDRIICYEGGGDTVKFTHTIRYFQPEDYIMGIPDTLETPFWEDPAGYRTWTDPPAFYEVVEFDLDGDPTNGPNGDGFETKGTLGTPNLFYVYDKPGNYTIRMRTVDSNGCEQILVKQDFIKVVGVVADFDKDPHSICADAIVKFFDKSYSLNNYSYIRDKNGNIIDSVKVDSVTNWFWTFGDDLGSSSRSKLENPVHTYLTNGDFDVYLRVISNNGCEATITKPAFIRLAGPQPKFALPSDFACLPLDGTPAQIYVRDSTLGMSGSYQYEWIMRDGSQNPTDTPDASGIVTLNYQNPGTFNLSLKATVFMYDPIAGGTKPCVGYYGWPSDTIPPLDTFPITIESTAPSAFTGDTMICAGTATFEDKSDPRYTSVKWDFGDGSPEETTNSGEQITHKYDLTGNLYDTTYTVSTYTEGATCRHTADPLTIRVQRVTAGLEVWDRSLPAFTIGNLCKGPADKQIPKKYVWSIEGIDDPTYKQVLPETKDTSALLWNFEDNQGKFKVCISTWIDPLQCWDSACIIVENEYDTALTPCNIFTPNGDGFNDIFYFEDIQGVTEMEMLIYNRWGEKVYEFKASRQPDDADLWDGTKFNDGTECPAGTYYFVIYWKWRGDDKLHETKGTVTLIREQ
jgi:gliding motility-associated-like protein